MRTSLKQRRLGSGLLTPIVINGERWTARRVQNNNFKQNCKQLARTFRPGRAHQRRVEELRIPCLRLCQAIELRSSLLEKGSVDQYWIQALLRVAAYEDKWIRQPEEWIPDRTTTAFNQFRSLVEHLFCLYSMPGFLTNVWFTRGSLLHCERDWYCQIGRGESLRKTIRERANLSAKAVHRLSNVPVHYSINMGIRYVQLASLNASDELIEAVLDSSICDKFGLDEVWIPLFMMMCSDPDFDLAFVGVIGDYIVYEYNKTMSFSLRGRTLQEIQNSAAQSVQAMMKLATYYGYHFSEKLLENSELRRQIFYLSQMGWSHHDTITDFEVMDADGDIKWKIVELNHQQDLLAEGNILHHCISSWGMSCREGKYHIFSLRMWEEDGEFWDSYVTIAISKTGEIREMRSIFNSLANQKEMKIINQWIKKYNLKR